MKDSIIKAVLRIFILGSIFAVFYSVIVIKLWDEQIRLGEEHREKVSKQSIRRIRLPAVRGRIYSSDMHILADNIISYDIVFHPAEMRQPGKQKKTVNYIFASAYRIGTAIGRKSFLTPEGIRTHIVQRPALPITVFKDLSNVELANAIESASDIQGMEIKTIPKRFYPGGKTACHVLGYVGLEDPGTAEDRTDYSYYLPDWNGRDGVEKTYDKTINCGPVPLPGLRGSPGNEVVRIDNLGFVHETIGTAVPPQNGNDIVLTLNWRAQTIAEKILADRIGSFVLLDASTGAVIAMVSSPGYEPQLFVPKIKKDDWKRLLSDSGRPLVNRATSGEYTPGSIIKPVIAMAALESWFNPLEKIECDGSLEIGNAAIHCWSWKNGGHGNVDMLYGIEQSCNIYFMVQGRRLGFEKLRDMMESAGIGRKTGFCIPERAGQIPSMETKQRLYGEKWTVYDTCLISIGQGIITLTPLQVALYVSAIANGGSVFKPYLLQEVRDPNGNTLYMQDKPEKMSELKVKKENLEIIREGMYRVVNGEKGTAKKARNEKITLCGKTGTAEIGPKDNRKTNTWFMGFGKHKDKTYGVAVIVQEGVSGGSTCAPIVGQFFNEWIEDSKDDYLKQEAVSQQVISTTGPMR
ncbi:MAG TPA: penicillin-binding protein 2 [Lentisphaeria bacterium]|nr:MAG: penicillin-binding protein 2 [Lentisphaerae bacterium GWF2_49_21]HBC87097.1 penicillin-binding protein 2 [Lentisphaeria bacterium]